MGAEHGASIRPKSTTALDRPEIGRDYDIAAGLRISVQAFWRLPEVEQDLWRQRFDREQGKCPHCGNPREACSDPDKKWYPQLTVCYATRARLAAQRRWDERHKDRPFHDGTWNRWQTKPRLGFFHYAEGTTVWVAQADLGLGGDFLGLEKPTTDEPQRGSG